MTAVSPIFAGERKAALLMDMRPKEFLDLVHRGVLPRPCDIGGHKRWNVDELRKIASGEMIDDLDDIDFRA